MPRRTVALAALAVTLAACGAAAPERPARRALPPGVANADGTALYTTRIDATAGRTRVEALRPQDGRALRAATLPGRWVIPAIAGTDRSGSLSGDGRTIAMAGPTGDGTSAFALLDTRLAAAAHRFTLPGRWTFDALSPDGGTVYLLQHVGGTRYHVRAYDATRGRLREGAIIEKGETDPDMTGTPVAREIGPGGSPVYTLYRGGDHGAFVHALDTRYGFAICVDLPAGGAWGLAWSRGSHRLYAVDRTSGRSVRVEMA
jgi:outer membrane protein assembly factor BamB